MNKTMVFNLKHYESKYHIGTVVGTDYRRTEGLKTDTFEILYNDNLVFIGRIIAMLDNAFADNHYDILVYMD